MQVLRTISDLQAAGARLRNSAGPGGVLVPTMGALHAGHEALIRLAVQNAQQRRLPAGAVVSIFVNPTQFNDPADLARYPRTLEADLALCERAGASFIFAPDLETMYPPPPASPVTTPPLPDVAIRPRLEDAHRPGHFAGVCQVVLRLFHLLEPDAAVFGEKDWQQLQVLRAMTSAAGLPVEVVPHPIVRDPDGLAMSSRNRFLSQQERSAALAMPRALAAAAGTADPAAAEQAMLQTLRAAGLEVEYAVARDARSLGPVTTGHPARLLIAARAGITRLIDNAPWPDHGRSAHSSGKL